MNSWHNISSDKIFEKLSTQKDGLNDSEVKIRLKKYGLNISAKEKKTSIIHLLLNQFKSFIIYVLIGAAILSGLVGDRLEFIIILSIVAFIVLLSFFEEFKASKEMESLKKLTPLMTSVIRSGKKLKILSQELVVGDIIVISRGDLVPADCRIIEASDLQVDESALTGESIPITKHSKILPLKTNLSQRKNMVYAGGQVINGEATCVVINTSLDTELGNIASMVKETKDELSPLQKRLDKLGKQISITVIIISILIILIGLIRGEPINHIILLAIAVAVSGIPESLPAVIGVSLGIGMKRMAKKNAVIKRLAAVETLGTCTVICSDKTGTLTQNKMVIENIWTFGTEIKVSGVGFNPEGLFLKEELTIDPLKTKNISKLIEIGVLCNNATLSQKDNEWHVEGESTEGALIVLAKKAGFDKEKLHKESPKIHEHPFDSNRKCMSSIHLVKNKSIAYIKGAPEQILKKSNYYFENGIKKRLTKDKINEIIFQNEKYAKKGFRVLALAYKEHNSNDYRIKEVEKNLIFVGLVSIRDPPEPSAYEAIKLCKKAGVRVVMITGDNPITAEAVARELNILTEDQIIISGEELDALSEKQLIEIVGKVAVFARVTPKHKLKIIDALQKKGEIVAMTGDGVNDAPALKKADIGVAMGLTGTEVAKEASEMVIKDDNFSTIVFAIKEGRTIYNNIQKFIYYLLPGNISQVLIIFLATLFGFLPPLTPLMVLFINLITSDIPALGLSLVKGDPEMMYQKPRNPKEGILTTYILLKISQIVPLIVLGTLFLFMWELLVLKTDLVMAQTVSFAVVILFMIFHVFNAQHFTKSILSSNFFKNKSVVIGGMISLATLFFVIYYPPVSNAFGIVSLTFSQWIPIVIVSSSILLFIEIQKFIIKSELKEHEKQELFPTRN